MRAYVDLSKWMRDFERSANQRQDHERLKLAQLHHQGWSLIQRTPEQALTVYLEGAALARQLNEPYWELWYEYWCCEVHLYYLAWVDVAEGWATKNFVKAHRPAYRDCPFIGRLYIDCINVLYLKDVVGNKAKIEQMLNYMEQNVPLEYSTYTRLVQSRAGLHYAIDDWEAAASQGKRHLDLVQNIPFHKLNSLEFLATVAYHQKRPQEILTYSVQAQRTAQQLKSSLSEGFTCLAQAYAWSQLNDLEKARPLFEHGMRLMQDSSRPHGQAWYNYACGFHEATGDMEAALRLRDQQLNDLVMRNLPAHEVDCRLARLRVFGKMEAEDQFKSELEAIRKVLTRLKSPSLEQEKLRRIEAGDYS